jgi:hypothetical protein
VTYFFFARDVHLFRRADVPVRLSKISPPTYSHTSKHILETGDWRRSNGKNVILYLAVSRSSTGSFTVDIRHDFISKYATSGTCTTYARLASLHFWFGLAKEQ